MISLRYLKFVVFSFIGSSICAFLMFPGHPNASIGVVAVSSAFSIPFMSLIVVRLPVFKDFYKHGQDISIIDNEVSSSADYKAAPPMAGIVTAGAIGLILYPAGVSHILVPAFCGGVAASVMSFYYEP